MTAGEALQWADFGIRVGQWVLSVIIQLANESKDPVPRVSDILPSKSASSLALAAERLKAQRELAIVTGLDTDKEVASVAASLAAIGWADPERWARALYGLESPPRIELPASLVVPSNPFAAAVGPSVDDVD